MAAMTTQRLFWENARCFEFEARVQETLTHDGHVAVVLDRTCFYPTSGGQPHDTGSLNGVPVIDVVEEGERVIHVLADQLAGKVVTGVVDWARRFDHMQQHTGQHILSQAFERVLDAQTVSFHLGDESCTIDLAIPELGSDDAARVEELANRIVYEDGAVQTEEHAARDLAALGLRKTPDVDGLIRVVRIADFDICACCGTHLECAGQVGTIHIRRWERRREWIRVEFLCGFRALRDYRQVDATSRMVSSDLSVGVDELAGAVTRIQAAAKAAGRQVQTLRKRLLEAEMPRLLHEAARAADVRVVCQELDAFDAGNMRYLAQKLTAEEGVVALLAVTEPSVQLCFARSEGVGLNMGQILRTSLADFGGRGGGQPKIAQGGGCAVEDLDACLQRAFDCVVDALSE